MASGLATGWCERRAERDSTVLLVLCGEAEWGDGSSALLWAWGEGTSEAGPKDTGGPVPAHTQRLSASARPPPPPPQSPVEGVQLAGVPEEREGGSPNVGPHQAEGWPGGLVHSGDTGATGRSAEPQCAGNAAAGSDFVLWQSKARLWRPSRHHLKDSRTPVKPPPLQPQGWSQLDRTRQEEGRRVS